MERKLVISWWLTMCYFVVYSDGNKYEYPPPFYTHPVVVDHVILEGEKLYKEVHKRDTNLLLRCYVTAAGNCKLKGWRGIC